MSRNSFWKWVSPAGVSVTPRVPRSNKVVFKLASKSRMWWLMAGCVTFPVVASFGLADLVSESTVGTLFIALPTGLASLGVAGRVVAVLFLGMYDAGGQEVPVWDAFEDAFDAAFDAVPIVVAGVPVPVAVVAWLVGGGDGVYCAHT